MSDVRKGNGKLGGTRGQWGGKEGGKEDVPGGVGREWRGDGRDPCCYLTLTGGFHALRCIPRKF